MIFQHAWEKVLRGEKTQTRRIVKPIPSFMSIGKTYTYEAVYLDDAVPTEDGSRYIHKVSTVHYRHGGWKTGELCIEPEETSITKWEVGKTYAVQPGWGKPGIWWCDTFGGIRTTMDADFVDWTRQKLLTHGWQPLRIRVLSIRREDVREISEEDVLAEGFGTRAAFLLAWIAMHDKQAVRKDQFVMSKYVSAELLDGVLMGRLWDRPFSRYDAWVLTFELAKDER